MRSTLIGAVAGAVALISGAYSIYQYYTWQQFCSTHFLACPYYGNNLGVGIILLIVGALLVANALYPSKQALQPKGTTANIQE